MSFEVVATKEEEKLYSVVGNATATADVVPRTIASVVVTGRFVFDATGFRRTMLRNLVGYCVDVCRGLPGVPSLDQVFPTQHGDTNTKTNNDIAARIHAAPAVGLCLESVEYETEYLDSRTQVE